MIIRNSHYWLFSQNSNTHYWEQDLYPAWTPFTIIHHFPEQRMGQGSNRITMTATKSGFFPPPRRGLAG